jgi:hypothetical protein
MMMIIRANMKMMLIPLRKGMFIEKEPDDNFSKNIERLGIRIIDMAGNKK